MRGLMAGQSLMGFTMTRKVSSTDTRPSETLTRTVVSPNQSFTGAMVTVPSGVMVTPASGVPASSSTNKKPISSHSASVT